MFAEDAGELLAKLLVLLGESPDAGVGGFEASKQGSVGSALTCGNRRSGFPAVRCPQSLDLRAQVRLGIQPRSGYPGPLRDGLENDRLSLRVEWAEGVFDGWYGGS